METKQRTTTEIKTQHDYTVVMKDYITGREFNEIQNSYLEGAKVNVVDGKASIDGFDASAETKATDKMIGLMVVSVDGKTEDVINAVNDMRVEDYQEVIAKLNEISGKKKANDTNGQ